MLRSSKKRPIPLKSAIKTLAAFTLVLAGGMAVMAQPTTQDSDSLLEDLRACRLLTDANERLICYDAKVGTLIGAADAGEARIVNREEVRKTRRQLFGIALPDIAILRTDDGEEDEQSSDMLETTIASGRQTGPKTWRLTTIEGAVWEINNPPRKIAAINPGDKVVFKKASLGYYFIRINGQIGVKGRRVM